MKKIYLATDYPIESLGPSRTPAATASTSKVTAHSSTLTRLLTPSHKNAFRHLIDSIRSLAPGLELTGYAEEEHKLGAVPSYLSSHFPRSTTEGGSDQPPRVSIASIDTGLVAILDKLVLRRSNYFLVAQDGSTGAKEMCGKRSSYTMHVVDSRRQDGREMVDDTIVNVVDSWGRHVVD